MKREWSVRTVYLYLVCFVSLMLLVFGTIQLIRAAVGFIYPEPVYSPGPAEIAVRMQQEGRELPPEVIEKQVRFEQERQLQQSRHWRVRRVAESLALLVVALPIYIYHWRRIQREANTAS